MYDYGLCCGLWVFWCLLKGLPGMYSQSLRYILGILCATRARMALCHIMVLPSRPNVAFAPSD